MRVPGDTHSRKRRRCVGPGATESSYVQFAKDVPDGKKLIDEALSVK